MRDFEKQLAELGQTFAATLEKDVVMISYHAPKPTKDIKGSKARPPFKNTAGRGSIKPSKPSAFLQPSDDRAAGIGKGKRD